MTDQPTAPGDRFYILTLSWNSRTGVQVQTRHGLAERCTNATEKEIFDRVFDDCCTAFGAPKASTGVAFYYLANNP